MLHIVNGDSVGNKLRQGGVKGDILVWREIYTEGPVFADQTAPPNATLRAKYLEQAMGIPSREYTDTCAAQQKALADYGRYGEIVLWFEYDLFDQAMLCYLLHCFSSRNLGDAKLSLLSLDAYPGIERFRGLGQLSAQQLSALAGTWEPVSPEQLGLGRRLWEAYTSPDPSPLVRLLQGDTSSLPFAHRAFQTHLSRLPSVYNGLGIVEQTTLELVDGGTASPVELFERASDRLHWLGMGDLQYWRCLAKLSQSTHPLLKIDGLTAFPDYKHPSPSFGECRVRLTDLGKNVLRGEQDWIAVNGIDEWYGGVHLQGHLIQWRWDSSQNMVVSV